MKINRVKVENILSIGCMEMTFSGSGLTLVDGFDHDKGRFNGAGKSSIFNSLVWGLFDDLPRKVTSSEILKRGTKSGYVEVEVEASGTVYTVRRERPNKTTFLKDGAPEFMTQEEFQSKIGFTYDQFILSVYCPQNAQSRFIFLNDSGKKDFLLKLMNLDVLDEMKEKAQEIASSAVSSIESNEKTVARLNSVISVLEASLQEEDSIKTQLVNLGADESILQSDLDSIKLDPPDFSKYTPLELAIQKKRDYYSSIRAEVSLLEKERRKLSSKITEFTENGISVSCPSCKSALSLKGTRLLEEQDIEGLRKAHLEEQDSILSQIEDLQKEIDLKKKDLLTESELDALVLNIAESKKKDSVDYNAGLSLYKSISTKIAEIARQKGELRAKIASNDGIKNQLVSNRASINTLCDEIESHKKTALLYKEVASVFGPTGAPAYIMDSVVDTFNSKVGEYVSATWPNATYSLQAFKENKDKSVKAKFSESLVIDGKNCSIGSISGGELTALSLAVDFALFDTVSSMFGIDCNIMIFDEPFTGVDNLGKEVIMETIRKMSESRQVFVVDHGAEIKAIFDNVINIEKRNGTSSLVF
jgi:DNA repair exonuclease SbcCD ATPase subunit